MELEFDKRGIPFLQILMQEVQTQEQTQELRLSEGMPDLGRVLGTWGQVILRSKEWRGDRVSIGGGIMAFVLYAPEDGSEPRTLESWIPFQMKWDLPDDRREGQLRVQCLMRFLDARSVSPRKLMLRCGISAQGQAFREETAMVSQPGQTEGDIQLLKTSYPLRFWKAAGEKTFQLEEEFSLSGLKMPVSYTLEPNITECRLISGRLVIRGSAALHVVYLTGDGQLKSENLEVPISQFAEPEGNFSADAQCDVRMAVTSMEADLTPEGKLRVKAGLVAQFLVDDRELVEIVSDAYSPERSVTPKLEELEIPQILEQQRTVIPVRQTIRQNAKAVADVTYLPDFATIHRGDGVQMELPGQFQVLWQDENGNLQSSTARTEENFDMPAGEHTRIIAAVLPGAAPMATAGSGLELKGESLLSITSISCQGIPMVTGLTIGDTKSREDNRPSLILRRAGEADLWNIAKSTGSTISAIRKANGLESEPDPEQILLIPVS